MPRGTPNPKETIADLLGRFMAPVEPLSKEAATALRPKVRAAYTEFVKRKRKRA
jgi:hypothetical protein